MGADPKKKAGLDDKTREQARQIMERAISFLKTKMSALVLPLNTFQLEETEDKETGIATDGIKLIYHPGYVMLRYADKKMEGIKKEIAHIVFHGLLGHFEIWDQYSSKKLISVIMDIQVKRLMLMSGFWEYPEMPAVYQDVFNCEPYLYNAQNVEKEVLDRYSFGTYYRAISDKELRKELWKLNLHVASDDHKHWMVRNEKDRQNEEEEKEYEDEYEDAIKVFGIGANGRQKGKSKHAKKAGAAKTASGAKKEKAGAAKTASDGKEGKIGTADTAGGKEKKIAAGKAGGKEAHRKAVAKTWSAVREALFGEAFGEDLMGLSCEFLMAQMENLCSKAMGFGEGGNSEKIDLNANAKNDYRDLLRKIVKENEVTKERDNIDYAIYQYGLSLYGDVPLIEPLECIEEKRLDNLVIAIDTSGSCQGEIVKDFISDTASFLKEIGTNTVFEGIYLIQCDAAIQKEEYFASPYELDGAIENGYRAFGFGGTDFRPVFDRMEELRKEGKSVNALLYLSDGWGLFPDQKPEYPVYFLVPKGYGIKPENSQAPDWVNILPMNFGTQNEGGMVYV